MAPAVMEVTGLPPDATVRVVVVAVWHVAEEEAAIATTRSKTLWKRGLDRVNNPN
jgi:hypothetical protein